MVSKALGEQNLILAGRTLNPRLHPPPWTFRLKVPYYLVGLSPCESSPTPRTYPAPHLRGTPPWTFRLRIPHNLVGLSPCESRPPPLSSQLEFTTNDRISHQLLALIFFISKQLSNSALSTKPTLVSW